MELKAIQIINTDVLVIGGGGAGLRAAIEARKNNVGVLIVSSSRTGYGNNTAIAGGAMAATGWGKPEDNPEQHFRDTMRGGRFINNQRLVDIMVRGAKQQVYDLMEYGVKFIEREGSLFTRQVPGHAHPRTVTCEQRLGIGFTVPMVKYAQRMGIQFKQGILITKLLKVDGAVVGAIGLDKNGQVFAFNAKSTILATGGLGHIFLRTNNAASINGIGYYLAYEAGTTLLDMEFTQFYPTSLADYGGSAMIVYERIPAPEKLLIKNSLGEDVLEKYGIKDVNLRTRDVLARVIMQEIVQGRGDGDALIMDLSALPEQSREQVPSLLVKHLEGVSQFRVTPTTHYQMGGVRIDERGKTVVSGLYAAGEVCGGIQGASRLGSNALTDIFLFGAIAGDSAAKNALGVKLAPIPQSIISDEKERLESLALSDGDGSARGLRKLLKTTMWYKVGVVRDEEGLKKALNEIDSIRHRLKRVSATSYRQLIEVIELSGMLTVSEMMARAALMRTESRGAHYRTDYPEENNEQWLKNIKISCESGNITLRTTPVLV